MTPAIPEDEVEAAARELAALIDGLSMHPSSDWIEDAARHVLTAAAEVRAQAGWRPIESSTDAIHNWFNLTYASYLTIPRSVLQSMPGDWQAKLVSLLNEMNEQLNAAGIQLPETRVSVHGAKGRFMHDWLADYQRGRRNVFTEGSVQLPAPPGDAA